MLIVITDTLCRVAAGTQDEKAWIRGYLSFNDVQVGRRKKRVSLFNDITETFAGGLLPLVQDAATRDNVTIQIMDKRVPRIAPSTTADLAWLRDYQKDAVEACVTHKRGIVRAPTGSGKGDMIVGVTKRLPGRWLFLVHRDNLVSQQAKRYKRLAGKEPNVMSRTPAETWKLQNGLNLITFQSLAAALRRDTKLVDAALADLDGIMVDECHVAPADVYFNALQRCPAEYRLGFSGTPLDRTDNRSLMAIAALGKVIYSIKAQQLIDAGVLAMPDIKMVQVRQPKVDWQGDFHAAYEQMIVDSDVRNDKIVDLACQAKKPCMIFVKQIPHGRNLQRALEGAGLRTEFVWGNTKPAARDAAIERLERRDADVLVASVVFQEGVDIPSLESVIIASGGRSVIAALQRIGRGMRTNGGSKTTFEVFDILDLGTPMFERHARRRMNTYVREGYQTTIQDEAGAVSTYKPKLMTRKERRTRVL